MSETMGTGGASGQDEVRDEVRLDLDEDKLDTAKAGFLARTAALLAARHVHRAARASLRGLAVPGPKLRFETPNSPSSASPSETGLFFASSTEPSTSTDWIELLSAC